MQARRAGLLFMVLCVGLAILLLTRAIRPLTGGVLLAIGLVVFGVFSRGFRAGRS